MLLKQFLILYKVHCTYSSFSGRNRFVETEVATLYNFELNRKRNYALYTVVSLLSKWEMIFYYEKQYVSFLISPFDPTEIFMAGLTEGTAVTDEVFDGGEKVLRTFKQSDLIAMRIYITAKSKGLHC